MKHDKKTELAGLAASVELLDRRNRTLDRKLLRTAKGVYRLALATTVAAERGQLPTSYEQLQQAGHPVGEGSLPDQARQVILRVQGSLALESSQSEQG